MNFLGLERKQLLISTEEVGWLSVPIDTIDENKAGMAEGPENISLYPVIRKISGPAPLPVPESTTSGSVDVPESKNKDGNGNKRKNRRAANDNLVSDDYRSKIDDQCHFKNIESFVAHEEIFLNGVFGVLSQVSTNLKFLNINLLVFLKSELLLNVCEMFLTEKKTFL